MKLTQNDRVRRQLEKFGRISNFSAIRSRLTYRLAARIADLREAGMKIRTEKKKNKDTVYVLETV